MAKQQVSMKYFDWRGKKSKDLLFKKNNFSKIRIAGVNFSNSHFDFFYHEGHEEHEG